MDPLQIAAAVWAALGKIAGKETRRELLAGGLEIGLELEIKGLVDGQLFAQNVVGALSVGADTTRTSSSAPDRAKLVAWILSQLNTQTREKILRELPESFAAAGNKLPDVDPVLLEATEGMLGRLRAKVSQPVQGPLSCRYHMVNGKPSAE